ncbi:MAG: glutamate-1-semialdehyde 2,1-aminomutase [Candidatus Thermoplasmatota archaeon]|jgi:glutamate-1-semialdehyde 2,1-aminomutase|nr:glutamate-1-semialdehyde 2,1-aminomutase [Candidatus Thermoplasmatota archaeon]MCL5987547.1 glutamate-1-semialdehyde 2,1-aminomutase [Candidatus Thermoplasmatota archaeon]
MVSSSLFNRASKVFPGGVNSPVRYYTPEPIYFARAKGTKLLDEEGKEYLDFSMGFGAVFTGYANSDILDTQMEIFANPVPEGVVNEKEIILGEMINEAVPSMEMMRFTNSGTEATMHAIRLARAFTGRDIIVKMNGGFHGAHDYVLIGAGSGAATFGTPTSPGIPEEIGKTVLVGEFNHRESLEQIFEKHGNNIAAVIVEPIMGNMGVILPEPCFLEFLRDITEAHGALLIFDEVITGFRFRYGAYQDMIGIRPDLTTMGKIIGGGLPVGVFGGREEIMKNISPQGKVYQSGTFSANPYTMATGIATLEYLKKIDYQSTIRLACWIEDKLKPYEDMGLKVNRAYNMFTPFFNQQRVWDYPSAVASDSLKFMTFFRGLLKHGIYLSPGQFETSFVGPAHSPESVEMAAFKMVYTLENEMNESGNA